MRSKWQNPNHLLFTNNALLTNTNVICAIAGYVGYTCWHLFQRINEHKHAVFGQHLWDIHNLRNKDLHDQFTILKKCCQKVIV